MSFNGRVEEQASSKPDRDYFILARPWAELASAVTALFTGRPEITVLLDRRYQERRAETRPAPEERRVGDRRRRLWAGS